MPRVWQCRLTGTYETITRCEGDNWEGNACLIAAAPELLEALEKALDELNTVAWVAHPEGPDGAQRFNVRRSLATAAIAKAKGLSV
jgi:hypothetical protein